MDTLFDRDFYPTPKEVIYKMLVNVDTENKIILEPSAGSGTIVDVLKERGAKQILACETNTDLRRLLTTKCQVIAEDFLTLTKEDVNSVQLIIANVPFSRQEDHIQHMIDIAPDGCEIITLCNINLFKDWNRTQKADTIIETVEKWGWHEELGEVFMKSDRPTNVHVGLIHIFKPRTGKNMFEDYFIEEDEEETNTVAGIMPYNEIRDYVNRYVEAVKRFESVMEANRGINGLISTFGNPGIHFGAYAETKDYGRMQPIDLYAFRTQLQKHAWRFVFNKLNMGKYLTSRTMDDLDAAISQQENFPFTMKNIYRMLELLVATHSDRMKQCITEAFDKICSYSADNSTAGEKWKTNSDYMINRRFIIPYMCSYREWLNKDKVNVEYTKSTIMSDITKALCMVTGTRYENTGESLERIAGKHKWGEKFNYSFFLCKGFKKGTMHFEFRDESVWQAFNRTVAEIRGWHLPSNTKKTPGNRFK